jgi:Tol biopolymer transport system component
MKKLLLSLTLFSIVGLAFGQEVLYYCSRPLPDGTGAWQVYRKNLTAATISTITSNQAYNYWWVELSPDKTKLLMLRSPYSSPTDQFDYANCEMIKSNADGSNPQVILADNQYGWFAFGNPHWHPSGNRILMIAQPTSASQPFYLVTVDTCGNNPTLLTIQFSIDGNWSPSGDKIVFIGIKSTGFIDATSFEVFTAKYTYSTNTVSYIKQVTNDVTRDHDPCFSPDGSKIAFSASDANITDADLVTIDTSGNNRTALLNDNGVHGGPLNWGTDGKIYHHSIYLGITDFTVNAYNTTNTNYQTFFASASFGYISPYYADLSSVDIKSSFLEKSEVKIFPNPFSTETNFFTNQNLNNATLTIYSSCGQIVKQVSNISGQTISLNRDNLSSGVYFIRVTQSDKLIATTKLIITD